MQQRRRIQQNQSLEQRLADDAKRLRKEAQGTPPGIERDRLIRRARQAETASHMSEWLSSPGLQTPN
jgi:predicted trehalose synthase